MALTYGFLKATIGSNTTLQSSKRPHELQYHLHTRLTATPQGGAEQDWDSAISVGTTDSDDLLQYKLVYDFDHATMPSLKGAPEGFTALTGKDGLPALDFLRSDVLSGTGIWRPSDVMDGSLAVEPVASLMRLLGRAKQGQATLYVFGRTYTDGSLGIHDVHMNQGSTKGFINHGNDSNDHNDIWQDGALLVDLGEVQWAAYFPAFGQQIVPTDQLGNPKPGAHPVTVADDGSQAQ
jgi:hypothetical protein